MMMSGDKNKNAVAIILEGLKKQNSDAYNERAKPEPELDQGLMSASEEMLKAIKNNNPKQFALALSDFFDMIDIDEPYEEEEGQEQE